MKRVVVIGNGMAGARLVDELLRRPMAADITVFGGEQRPAYNRILLSDVLAGTRSQGEVALARVDGPVRHVHSEVVAVDRDTQTVSAADGTCVAYDELVLATGSLPVIPPVQGIAGPSGQLLDGVFVFRTLADCEAIAQRAKRSTRAIVVGGGLLGLEAARGLLQHGLRVDVVHGMSHLMDLQLDPMGGAVLRRSIEALGVGVHLGSFASRVLGARSVQGVGLADGRTVPGDLVVLACGVRPHVELARSTGLTVNRGIVVDDELRTDDASVSAIGECAEHRGTVYGLVAPAWEQAAILADRLAGIGSTYEGSRLVTRLKAMDLEVASMGDTRPDLATEEAGVEVLVWADPAKHVYKKVVLRDGVVAGAVMVGDLSTVGPLTQAFDRGSRAPRDRAAFLFTGRGRASGPAADADTICTCNAVTAGELRESGCRTVAEAALKTRATTGCGTCTSSVAALLAAHVQPVKESA